MENSGNEIEKFLDQLYSERYSNQTYYNYRSSRITFNRMTQCKRIKKDERELNENIQGQGK